MSISPKAIETFEEVTSMRLSTFLPIALLVFACNGAFSFTSTTDFTLVINPQYYIVGQENRSVYIKADLQIPIDWSQALSPGGDGKVLVYRCDANGNVCYAKSWELVYNEDTGEARPVTDPMLYDFVPSVNQAAIYYYKACYARQVDPIIPLWTPIWTSVVPVYVSNAMACATQFSGTATRLIDPGRKVVDTTRRTAEGTYELNIVAPAHQFPLNAHHWVNPNYSAERVSPAVIKRNSQLTASTKFWGMGPLNIKAGSESVCGGAPTQSVDFGAAARYASFSFTMQNNLPNNVWRNSSAFLQWRIQPYCQPYAAWKDIQKSVFDLCVTYDSPWNGGYTTLYQNTCEWAKTKSTADDVFTMIWQNVNDDDSDGYAYWPYPDPDMPHIITVGDLLATEFGKCGAFANYMQRCLDYQGLNGLVSQVYFWGYSPDYTGFNMPAGTRGAMQFNFADHQAVYHSEWVVPIWDPSYGIKATSDEEYENHVDHYIDDAGNNKGNPTGIQFIIDRGEW